MTSEYNKTKVKRIGPAGTFEWVLQSKPEIMEAFHRMNNAIAKSRQGHGEYVPEIHRAFADYVERFGNTIVQAYNGRDQRRGSILNGMSKVDT